MQLFWVKLITENLKKISISIEIKIFEQMKASVNILLEFVLARQVYIDTRYWYILKDCRIFYRQMRIKTLNTSALLFILSNHNHITTVRRQIVSKIVKNIKHLGNLKKNTQKNDSCMMYSLFIVWKMVIWKSRLRVEAISKNCEFTLF